MKRDTSQGGANMGPHSSDAYTSRTMAMARNGHTPNMSTGVQKGPPMQQSKTGGGANTPNSSPSVGPLQKTNRNYGEPMVRDYKTVPQVTPLTGIPAHDPNEGGANQLSKSSRNYGFTTRKSGGG